MKTKAREISLLFAIGAIPFWPTAAERPNSPADQQTLTGVITDSMCGATHMAKDKSPAECTRMCVKDGQKYALAVDKKVYTLEGHDAELSKLAGQKVTVKGMVNGTAVTVDSVAAAK